MNGANNVQMFKETVLAELARVGEESRIRMMRGAATFGAASLLCEHFGSAEAVGKIPLLKQINFLLHKSPVQPQLKRNRLALAWAHHNLSHSDPNNLGLELAETLMAVAESTAYIDAAG